MKCAPFMKLATIVGALAAVGGFIGLLLMADPGRVAAMIVEMGAWLVLLATIHLGYILVLTFAWRALLRGQGVRRPVGELYRMRWIADAVNALVPFVFVAGEALRGVLQARETDVRGDLAAAVIIVELTARFLSLVLFVAGGLVVLAARNGGGQWGVLGAAAVGLLILLAGFWWAQRSGGLMKVAGRIRRYTARRGWEKVAGDLEEVDRRLPSVYADRRRFATAVGLHFLAWVVSAGEMILVLRTIGRPAGPVDAWVFESIGQLVRNAGFFAPASLGAQEGGYALGAMAIGAGAAVGVGVSVIKRVRDLIIGLPALALWQWRAWRRQAERG